MHNRPLLEICVESVEFAAAADQGGADRLELCSELPFGGITPSADLMRATRLRVRIPVHVLIRPRPGSFTYSTPEFETMKREIALAQELGMDGIVVGLLDEDKNIDRKRTSILVSLAHPLPVTFHRAFDLCANLPRSLQVVIETGCRRVLSAGGKTLAADGISCLADLVAAAEDNIVIMPGGGIRAGNIERILGETGATEVHSSLGGATQLVHGSRQTSERSDLLRIRQAADFQSRVTELSGLISQSSL